MRHEEAHLICCKATICGLIPPALAILLSACDYLSSLQLRGCTPDEKCSATASNWSAIFFCL